jgi:hypothetical protein
MRRPSLWTTTVLAFAAWSCNNAPTEYLSDEVAPGGSDPYDHPTDTTCKDTEGSIMVDGFLYCPGAGKITSIDDPVLHGCSETTSKLKDADEVFYVYDGRVARAYPTKMLGGRELVHEDWNSVPVLVDW